MRVLYDRQLGLLLLDFKADFFEPRNTGSYETGKRQETARFDRRAWESARPDRPLNHANFNSRQIDRTWKRFLAGQFTRENAFYLASFPLRVVSASSSFSKPGRNPWIRGKIYNLSGCLYLRKVEKDGLGNGEKLATQPRVDSAFSRIRFSRIGSFETR